MDETKPILMLLSFSREGPIAWIAHLDLMRCFERAFRRAGLPLRWSQGFNPRPSLVFALPLGVGLECEADLLEIELCEEIPVETLPGKLNAQLPQGLRINKACLLEAHTKSLMNLVEEAVYRFSAREAGLAWKKLAAKAEAGEEILVERKSKGKIRQVSLFSSILAWEVLSDDEFRLRVKAGSRENLRPDLCLQALKNQSFISPDDADDARIIREKLILSEFCSN